MDSTELYQPTASTSATPAAATGASPFAEQASNSSTTSRKRSSIAPQAPLQKSTAQQKSTAAQAPLQKRNRQHLSCAECRRLKLKCDRVWPCSSCRKRGCAELCPHSTSKPPGRALRVQAEMNALAERVEQLSELVMELGGEERLPPLLQLEFAGKSGAGAAATAGGSGGDKDGGKEEEDEHVAPIGQEEVHMGEDEEDPIVQEMAAGVGMLSVREEDGRTRFLGTSAGSAYYFQDDEDSASSDEDASPAPQMTFAPFIQLGGAYSKSQELERLRIHLPSPEEVERLSKAYWAFLSFQFQPVEEEVYWNDYLPCAMTTGNTHGAKLACTFIILSLGSIMDPRAPSTPNPNAHHYFQLAFATLSSARYLSHNTLAGVQTVQLAANFLLNTHDLQEGGESLWPLLGQGIKMLVSMGLHRDGSRWGLEEPELTRRRIVFYEFITLERMQAFISGRPHAMAPHHFDTVMPTNVEPFHIEKWKLGVHIARVIDQAFSVTSPSYSTVTRLDEELRALFKDSPADLRSGALPATAFVVRPTGPPVLPEGMTPAGSLKDNMRKHTLDMIFSQIFFYLHLPALRQALSLHPEEPLSSPWASSVAVVSLESAPFMLALARSWISLHAVLCPRWWHIFFHSFAASVAQSSIVIKSPKSLLARHAWQQLNIAIDIFETAGAGGAPVSMFCPRLRALRDTALLSLQNAQGVPLGMNTAQVSDFLAEGTDANLSILGPTTRLERKPRKRPEDARSSASPTSLLSSILLNAPPPTPSLAAATVPIPVADQPYSPFDSPVLPKYTHPANIPFDPFAGLGPAMRSQPQMQHHQHAQQHAMQQAPTYHPSTASSTGPFQFRPPPSSGTHTPAAFPPPPPPSDPSAIMGFTNFATGASFPPNMWSPAGASFGAPEVAQLAASVGAGGGGGGGGGASAMSGLEDQWMFYDFGGGRPPTSG